MEQCVYTATPERTVTFGTIIPRSYSVDQLLHLHTPIVRIVIDSKDGRSIWDRRNRKKISSRKSLYKGEEVKITLTCRRRSLDDIKLLYTDGNSLLFAILVDVSHSDD